MKQLEILMLYLPYNIEVKQLNVEGKDTFTLDIEGLRMIEAQGAENFMPVLRPFSDLKSIIKQALSFKGASNVVLTEYYSEDNVIDGVSVTYQLIGETFTEIIISRGNFDECRLANYNYFLSKHLDIFNLIEKGCAVRKEEK